VKHISVTEKAKRPYEHYHFSSANNAASLQYIVKGILNKRDLALIHGEPGSGKSFLALDLAMASARGLNWFNARTNGHCTVYMAAESAHGFSNRLFACMKHHSLVDYNAKSIPLHVIPASPKLSGGDDYQCVIQTLGEIAEVECRPVDCLFIDTVSSVMQGADENTSEGMGTLLANAKRIREACGCAVILIHHDSKVGKDARGHSSLKGDTDCIIQVERSGDNRSFTVRKSKEGKDGQSFGFTLKVIELGTDSDGDPITSCVIEPTGEPVTQRKREPKGQAGIALQALRDAIAKVGELLTPSDHVPTPTFGTKVEIWRLYCDATISGGVSPSAARTAFMRAKTSTNSRHIASWNEHVWIVQ
jgi:AAA domain